MLYLDNASTTKPKQEVIDAMMPYLTDEWYNPSSLYSPSQQIKAGIELARETVGNFIGARGYEIYFTSSGSESNNWAIQGFINNRFENGELPYIATTTIEHKSITECVEHRHNSVDLYRFDVDEFGFVVEDYLKWTISHIKERNHKHENGLFSIQLANNEIGTIQNMKLLSDIVHEYGAYLHVDATQAFAHIPIDVDELGIDMMTASGHKLGCPKGTAFLYVRGGVEINPLIYGSQMDGMRGGTENVAGIMGMKKAVELVNFDCYEHMVDIRDKFIDKLEAIGCKLNGDRVRRLPNNINVIVPGVGSEELLYMLDMAGIKISTQSACNSMSIEPSHVLKAIGLSDADARSSIRITFDENLTTEDMDYVVHEIENAIICLMS